MLLDIEARIGELALNEKQARGKPKPGGGHCLRENRSNMND